MKRNTGIILAIAALALAALACQAVTGGGATLRSPSYGVPHPLIQTAQRAATQSSTGNVLLSDNFSSAQWGTGTDSDSSVEYANEALQFIVFTKELFCMEYA